jgi:hypothetical protein
MSRSTKGNNMTDTKLAEEIADAIIEKYKEEQM